MSTTTEDTMTTLTMLMQQAIAAGGNFWTSSDGSKVRVYLNDWQQLAGADIKHYGTGNLASFEWRGEHVSNAKGGEIMGVKAYVDASGLHFQTYRMPRAESVFQAMQAALLNVIESQEV